MLTTDMFKVGQTVTLTIHGLGSSGEGVGYSEGYTLFVDGALPGEVVTVKLIECKRRYGRAVLIEIVQPSPHRVKPVCALFGQCGGCQLMHLDYAQQLVLKQQKVVDALTRIGKIPNVEVNPCIPSPDALHYRNKIQLPVKYHENRLAIGLYARSSHHLIEVDACYIHCAVGEQVYQSVKNVLNQFQLPKDELKHILIKSSISDQNALVILVTNQADSHKLIPIAKKLLQASPHIKGVIHNCNPVDGNVILGKTYQLLAGSDTIQEKLCGLTFLISPASFFQVNTPQAERLYSKALELSDVSGKETFLDAYCGVGTLSLIFAKHVQKVIGVECVPEAIENAKENARLNLIENAEFVCAQAEEFIKTLKNIDLALLNPPRKGCDPAFLEGIKRLAPLKIIYISCDPATLARDLADLQASGYAIQTVQPLDMFPQTSHVETIVKLVLQKPQ